MYFIITVGSDRTKAQLVFFELRCEHQRNSPRVLKAAVMFAEDISFEGGFVFRSEMFWESVPYFTSDAVCEHSLLIT